MVGNNELNECTVDNVVCVGCLRFVSGSFYMFVRIKSFRLFISGIE